MAEARRIIGKYLLPLEDSPVIEMGLYPKVIHVGPDVNGAFCVWAHVLVGGPTKPVQFHVRGTGMPVPAIPAEHVGSAAHGPFIWHVYAEGMFA